jgi:pimeloyl-ACP methyl ester carboxylesterase
MRVEGAGGVGIEVWVEGPEDGAPVLLLHGWPDSHDLWRHQVAALTEAGFRTIAPDLRGFGASDKPTDIDAYGVANSVFDMVAVLDELGLSKVNVVGHDWGAAVAWGFASFLPDRTERLVALSVGHPRAFRDAGFLQRAMSWYMLLFQFEGIAEQWLEQNGDTMLGGHPDSESVLAALREPGALTASLGWYRANAHPRTLVSDPPDLPPVQAPVLGVWSSGDMALTEQQMQDSQRYVTGPWRFERIEGVGHWMQAEAPAEVNRLLLDFLGG